MRSAECGVAAEESGECGVRNSGHLTPALSPERRGRGAAKAEGCEAVAGLEMGARWNAFLPERMGYGEDVG